MLLWQLYCSRDLICMCKVHNKFIVKKLESLTGLGWSVSIQDAIKPVQSTTQSSPLWRPPGWMRAFTSIQNKLHSRSLEYDVPIQDTGLGAMFCDLWSNNASTYYAIVKKMAILSLFVLIKHMLTFVPVFVSWG